MHSVYGDCRVTGANARRVTLEAEGRERQFAAPMLHRFLEFPIAVPDGHWSVALAAKANGIQELQARLARWQIKWSEIGDEHDEVVALLDFLDAADDALPPSIEIQCRALELDWCKARDKKGPFLGLKKGQLVQTKSLVRGMVVIGVGEAAVA